MSFKVYFLGEELRKRYGNWAIIIWWWALVALIIRLAGGAYRVAAVLIPPRTKVATRVKRGRREAEKPAWEVAATDTARGPTPPLHVAVLVVGTRGDVDPFCSAAVEIAKKGHRVRMATHACYRGFVADRAAAAGVSLEFYPLAGDPRRLSAWMVESGGRLLPDLKYGKIQKEIGSANEKMAMIQEILHSTWPACTARDPEAPDWSRPPFRAQAILSNPPAYGHVHCAEALRCPLLVGFPQPWTPTSEFPHVFANLPFAATDDDSQLRAAKNLASYAVVDELQWQGLDAPRWRRDVLGLSPLHASAGASLMHDLRIPFAGMWSPGLLPRTGDAGGWVDVVGAQRAPADDGGAVDEKLAAFLASGEPPIFLGFGSMVIADPAALWDLVVEAAEASGARVVVQSSWSSIEGTSKSPLVLPIGPMPHSRLFSKCSAAVHHGGAGTVHGTLGAGLPTLVVPFFGDQPLWGEVCRRQGVGPAPIPIAELTVEKLTAAFEELTSEDMKRRAKEVAARLAEEDGVTGLVDAWTKSLPPSRDLVCWPSLFCASEPRIVAADRWHAPLRMRLSREAEAAVAGEGSPFKTPYVYPYATRFFDTKSSAYRGHKLVSTLPEAFVAVLHAMYTSFAKPFVRARAAYNEQDHTGIVEASADAGLSFGLALIEAPLVLVILLLQIFFGICFGVFHCVFSCCYPRVLFDVPDPRQNSQGGAGRGEGGARGSHAVDRYVAAPDPGRAADLVDAAALGARVRDALASACPPTDRRDVDRLDAVTPAHARKALAALLEADWHLLRAKALKLEKDVESDGRAEFAMGADLVESRRDLRADFGSKPVDDRMSTRFVAGFHRLMSPAQGGVVDHDKFAATILDAWHLGTPWVSVVQFCVCVADFYHEAAVLHSGSASLGDLRQRSNLATSQRLRRKSS